MPFIIPKEINIDGNNSNQEIAYAKIKNPIICMFDFSIINP